MPQDAQHAIALAAIENLTAAGEVLYVTPQSLCEFWNVSTRPLTRNGYGLTAVQAEAQVQRIERSFLLAPDNPAIYPQWHSLVTQYNTTGVHVFDARLAAVALVYGIANVLTFNGPDFTPYTNEGIAVVDPVTVPDSQPDMPDTGTGQGDD